MTPEGLLLIVLVTVLCILIGTCQSKLPIAAKTAIAAIVLGGFAGLLGAASFDEIGGMIMSAFFTMLIVACTGIIVAKLDDLQKQIGR